MRGARSQLTGIARSDAVLAAFVVAVACMLLVPLPTALLDILIVINIAVSLLILLVGLYVANSLSLLAFPTLLLLTTLFRLALNVASTRLILSQADAGQVIHSFGTFLIRGQIFVGMIIFAIITIVNFIVIAKGASRVSEVAARFTLDSLPGKQMAIDADLRAGLLSPQEAEQRREELRQESQLFGSMDGAMKFVQGDAIAGLFIIFVNSIGGVLIGLSGGMGIHDAMEVYTTLTVGDALVTQIPALLMSICAGIIVTRVSSGKHLTLGRELGSQLFQRWGLVFFAGLLLLILGSLPGVAHLPFYLVAISFLLLSALLRHSAMRAGTGLLQEGHHEVSPPQHLTRLAYDESEKNNIADRGRSVLLVEMHLGEIGEWGRDREEHYRRRWRVFMDEIQARHGIALPALHVSHTLELPRDSVLVRYQKVFRDEQQVDRGDRIIEIALPEAHLFGFSVHRKVKHPRLPLVLPVIRSTPFHEDLISMLGVQHYDPVEWMLLSAAQWFVFHPETVLTMGDIHQRRKSLNREHPGLFDEALPSQFFHSARLTMILQEFVRQGGDVGDFKGIVEALAAYASTCGKTFVAEDEFDIQDILLFLRSRNRHETRERMQVGGGVRVITLEPETEKALLRAGVQEFGDRLKLAEEDRFALKGSLDAKLKQLAEWGVQPLALSCSRHVAGKLNIFLQEAGHYLPLLTEEDIFRRSRLPVLGSW